MPRSANRYLGQRGVLRQVEVARRQVEFDSFPDIDTGRFFRGTGRGATGEFRADRRVVAGLRVPFEDGSECHNHSIWLFGRSAERFAPELAKLVSPGDSEARTRLAKADVGSNPEPLHTGDRVPAKDAI